MKPLRPHHPSLLKQNLHLVNHMHTGLEKLFILFWEQIQSNLIIHKFCIWKLTGSLTFICISKINTCSHSWTCMEQWKIRVTQHTCLRLRSIQMLHWLQVGAKKFPDDYGASRSRVGGESAQVYDLFSTACWMTWGHYEYWFLDCITDNIARNVCCCWAGQWLMFLRYNGFRNHWEF